MKHKVSELEGALLDAAVARALGADWHCGPPLVRDVASIMGWEHFEYSDEFEPSRLWEHGGPIIERERIALVPLRDGYEGPVVWMAWHEGDELEEADNYFERSTSRERWPASAAPLIAAMRTYVFSKFGDEVELP